MLIINFDGRACTVRAGRIAERRKKEKERERNERVARRKEASERRTDGGLDAEERVRRESKTREEREFQGMGVKMPGNKVPPELLGTVSHAVFRLINDER